MIAAVALVAVVKTFVVDPSWWNRHIAIVSVPIAGAKRTAIVDTGGYTELRSRTPQDFNTYYRGLPIDAAVGANSIPKYQVVLGSIDPSRAVSIPLRLAPIEQEIYAFVRVTIGDASAPMLLDTGALGYLPSDPAFTDPFGISFLRRSTFGYLRARYPQWPYTKGAVVVVNEKGTFVRADTLLVPSVRIGPLTTGPVRFVERVDDTTYATIAKTAHIDAQGDVNLNALNATGVELDWPHRRLLVGR